VGRASFDLSSSFADVIGLDYSQAFIDAANTLKRDGHLNYVRHDTGRFSTALRAALEEGVQRERIQFVRGDASALRAPELLREVNMKGFDAVLLSNLLCRLPDPAACLRQFVEDDTLLNDQGVLVIVSPNSWMEQYTAPDNYLDGPDNAGALKKIGAMLPGFTLVHEGNLPFMIREHRRKYEYIVSQVSVWRKG
jgi:SAM-dependent methyltransferase